MSIARSGSLRPRMKVARFCMVRLMVCYDALQEAGLLPRLTQARTTAQEALYDPFTKQRLAEGLAKHLRLDASAAYIEAERWLVRLDRQLAGIPIKQRLIDGRMADFARLSDARHRYQTEMRGRRPGQVKTYLGEAARLHVGITFAQLAAEPGMRLLSPKIEVFFGIDSLARKPGQRALVKLDLQTPPAAGDSGTANEEIRRRNLNVLTRNARCDSSRGISQSKARASRRKICG